ncbi:MAG: phosphonate C-P lyase system protein PhnH [Cyanobacteria bacterium P01_H01_bin.153]
MLTQLPGFQDPVHDAQQTFRALLEALSRPGLPQTTAILTSPEGLLPSCAAAALTLFDLETTVWLQPDLPTAVRDWLLFHTGCPFTSEPQAADFAVIGDLAQMPDLTTFNWGSSEYPEASTSLLLQCGDLSGGPTISLRGPGIMEAIAIALPLSQQFWLQWQAMTASYPLGLDSWCFGHQQVIGLPRTARPTLPSV